MIPLWIAGGGEQLTLRTAARYADYTNFGGTLESFVHKSGVLAQHCERESREFSDITRSTNFNVLIGPDEATRNATLERLKSRFATAIDDPALAIDRLYGGIGAAVGTSDQIIEQLEQYAEAGMGYAIIYFPDAAYTSDSMEMFASEVMPAFV
jgi:alkanesulfonate monooxygenase SsuD/methylene tetrahydromethanopterin reductase-like flavin-dependent oxidoreductase (luciferase family)